MSRLAQTLPALNLNLLPNLGYLFRDRYGRPGKGNDKGNVEGLVGYSRRNVMVPVPRFATWDAFNGRPAPDHATTIWPCGPMRHGTRQLSGERACHGAQPQPLAWYCGPMPGFVFAVDTVTCTATYRSVPSELIVKTI